MPKLDKVWKLSLAVLLAQLLLTKILYPIIGRSTQVVGAIINPISGFGGTQIGDSIIGYLSGFTAFNILNLTVLISMYIGAFLLIYGGFWIYEQRYVKVPTGNNLMGRLFWLLLYSHVILYGILLLMKMSVPNIAFNLLIGLGVNLFFLAAIVAIAAEKLKFPKI